jgi:uncharacterized protein YaaN involved in tellurite resistance
MLMATAADAKEGIFEAIISRVGGLQTRMHSVLKSLGKEKLVPGRIKKGLGKAYDILTMITNVCQTAGKEWSEIKKMTIAAPTSQDRLFDDVEKLEEDEDKVIKLVKGLSAVIYSDREMRDFLKTNYFDIYNDLKRLMFHCIKAMLELKAEEENLEVQVEGIEKRFAYNAEAAIARHFPHIK